MMIEQSRVAAGTPVLDIALENGVRTPTDARHAVDAVLPPGDESGRQNVLLLATELVTNAVVHGRPPARLRMYARGERLLLEVSDCGPHRPVLMRPGPELDHGRGLLLVAALADDWGVDPATGAGTTGKVVWAELAYVPARDTSPA